MLSEIKSNPILRFLVVAITAYLLWFTVYEAFIKYPETELDRKINIGLVETAEVMLELVGFDAVPNYDFNEVTIKLSDSPRNGVWVGDKCNGMELFALFTIYVLAFPGPWRKKLWYVPLGIVSIHLINALRIAILTIIERDSPETLDFNHNYTFTILVYSFIFFLWYWWTVKLSGIEFGNNDKEASK